MGAAAPASQREEVHNDMLEIQLYNPLLVTALPLTATRPATLECWDRADVKAPRI